MVPVLLAGTTANWFLDHQINAPQLVFPAVGCCLVAILCGALAKVEDAKAQSRRRALEADLGAPLLPHVKPAAAAVVAAASLSDVETGLAGSSRSAGGRTGAAKPAQPSKALETSMAVCAVSGFFSRSSIAKICNCSGRRGH